MQKVSLAESFSKLEDVYVPKVVAELNGQYVKVVKFQGPYPWHHHDNEDELFLVIAGEIRLEIKGQEPTHLGPGEFLVVPKGVTHRPVADNVAHVVLFESATTRNTGNIDHEYTIEANSLERM